MSLKVLTLAQTYMTSKASKPKACKFLNKLPSLTEIGNFPSTLHILNTKLKCIWYNFSFPSFLGSVNHLLLVTNSSVNFVIYCCMARRFRKALIDLFRSWRCYCRCQEEVNDLALASSAAAPPPISNFFSTSKGRQRGFGGEDASSRYN